MHFQEKIIGESSFYDVEEGEFSFIFSLSRTLDSGIGIAPESEYITITSIEVYNRGTETTPDPSYSIDLDISASPEPTGSTEPTATPEPTATAEPTPAPEIPGEGDMNSFWVISYFNGQKEYVEVTED